MASARLDFRAATLDIYANPGSDITWRVQITDEGITAGTITCDVGGQTPTVDTSLSIEGMLIADITLTDTQTTTLGAGSFSWSFKNTVVGVTTTYLVGNLTITTSGNSSNGMQALVTATSGTATVQTLVSSGAATALAAHLADASDAHDATAVSYAGAAGLVATTVEAALDELDTDKQAVTAFLSTTSPTTPASTAATRLWAAARRRPAVTGALRACFIGDSIMIGNSFFTSTIWAWDDVSWPTYLLHASDGKIIGVRNAGVGSETTTQILARLATDVIAYNPDICFVGGGTNDGLAASATTNSNVRSMCNLLLEAGILPILVTAPPRGSANSANRQNSVNTSKVMRTIAADYSLPLVDFYTALVLRDGTGLMDPTYDADGTHPNLAGCKLMGDTAWAAIENMFTAPSYTQYDGSDSGNLISNALFLTGSASLPTGWTNTSGGASRANDVTGFAGYALTVTSAGGAKNAQATSSAITSGVRYRLSFRLAVADATAATRAFFFNQANAPRVRVSVDLDPKTVAVEWIAGASEAAPFFITGVADTGAITVGQIYMETV